MLYACGCCVYSNTVSTADIKSNTNVCVEVLLSRASARAQRSCWLLYFDFFVFIYLFLCDDTPTNVKLIALQIYQLKVSSRPQRSIVIYSKYPIENRVMPPKNSFHTNGPKNG